MMGDENDDGDDGDDGNGMIGGCYWPMIQVWPGMNHNNMVKIV